MTVFEHMCVNIYICVCAYVSIYIYLNVGSILYTSGSWHTILLPTVQPATSGPVHSQSPAQHEGLARCATPGPGSPTPGPGHRPQPARPSSPPGLQPPLGSLGLPSLPGSA